MQEDYSFLPLFIEEDIYIVSDETAIVKEETSNAKPKPETTASIPFLGENQQGILILADQLDETQQEFLLKILQAVKLGLKDVALVKLQDLEHFGQIEELSYRTLLSFGVQHDDFVLDMNTASYMVHKKPGKTYLLADSLGALMSDKKKKALLWANLQKVFL